MAGIVPRNVKMFLLPEVACESRKFDRRQKVLKGYFFHSHHYQTQRRRRVVGETIWGTSGFPGNAVRTPCAMNRFTRADHCCAVSVPPRASSTGSNGAFRKSSSFWHSCRTSKNMSIHDFGKSTTVRCNEC